MSRQGSRKHAKEMSELQAKKQLAGKACWPMSSRATRLHPDTPGAVKFTKTSGHGGNIHLWVDNRPGMQLGDVASMQAHPAANRRSLLLVQLTCDCSQFRTSLLKTRYTRVFSFALIC